MTAHAMVEEMEKCLSIGMNGHISKPIDLNQLFTELRKWISADSGRRAEAGKQKVGEKKVGGQKVGEEKVGEEKVGEEKATDGGNNALPDVLQGFDLAVCLRNLGGNKTLLKSLLADFYEEFSCTAVQIRTLLDQGDRQTAERLAHSIKGISGNLSATALYDAATRLDQALRAEHREHSDALPGLLDTFETALNEVTGGIAGLDLALNQDLNQDLQQEHTLTDDNTDIDMKQIRHLFTELAGLIEENSMDADKCLQRLKKQLNHPSFNQDMQELEAAINNFDFDHAQRILEHMDGTMNTCTNISQGNT